ncbi:MAG: HDOD domain-containing protein [Arcobacteraceae bacterium]
MNELIYERIDTLPPLPKTILELEEFKKTPERTSEDLLEIIQQDPLVVATILKVANSAMFGFRSTIETTSRALTLLGVNFTLSIAFSTSIKNVIQSNLKAYGIGSNDFLETIQMSSSLLSLWIGQFNFDLKEELMLPTFLQETGKFIISDIIVNQNRHEDFLKDLQTSKEIACVEKKYLSTTTSEVTASVFKKWSLSEKLINTIEFVDDIASCPPCCILEAKILNIIKTICPIINPLSSEHIVQGLQKAKEFELDVGALEVAIKQLQSKLNSKNIH